MVAFCTPGHYVQNPFGSQYMKKEMKRSVLKPMKNYDDKHIVIETLKHIVSLFNLKLCLGYKGLSASLSIPWTRLVTSPTFEN